MRFLSFSWCVRRCQRYQDAQSCVKEASDIHSNVSLASSVRCEAINVSVTFLFREYTCVLVPVILLEEFCVTVCACFLVDQRKGMEID